MLYADRECYAEANIKLLTTAAMVDNPAEKVDECPLNRGRKVLFAYNWDRESCPLYGVAGCPLLRGCLQSNVVPFENSVTRVLRKFAYSA